MSDNSRVKKEPPAPPPPRPPKMIKDSPPPKRKTIIKDSPPPKRKTIIKDSPSRKMFTAPPLRADNTMRLLQVNPVVIPRFNYPLTQVAQARARAQARAQAQAQAQARARALPQQRGAGACSVCGAPGTNATTCPWNPSATNKPNPAKHSPTRPSVVKEVVSRPRAPTRPGNIVASVALPAKRLKEGRLSAGEYYRTYGEQCVGDVCDIRGDGELKCLLIKSNGTPYWAAMSKEGKGQESCGTRPWVAKCKDAY